MAVVFLEGWEAVGTTYGRNLGNNPWDFTHPTPEWEADPPVGVANAVSPLLGRMAQLLVLPDHVMWCDFKECTEAIFGAHFVVNRYGVDEWSSDWLSLCTLAQGTAGVLGIWVNTVDRSVGLAVGGAVVGGTGPGAYEDGVPFHAGVSATSGGVSLYVDSVEVYSTGTLDFSVDRIYVGGYERMPIVPTTSPGRMLLDNMFVFDTQGTTYNSFPGQLTMLSFSHWPGSFDELVHYHRADDSQTAASPVITDAYSFTGNWSFASGFINDSLQGPDDLPFAHYAGSGEDLVGRKTTWAASAMPWLEDSFTGYNGSLSAYLADIVVQFDAASVGGDSSGLRPFLYRAAGTPWSGFFPPTEARGDFPDAVHPSAELQTYTLHFDAVPPLPVPGELTAELTRLEYGLEAIE
jgi:hypothetical protein